MRFRFLSLALVAAAAAPAAGEVRETFCSPQQVLVTDRRIEVTCRETAPLADRGRGADTAIARFAVPLLSQSFEPLLGSQVNLVDYYLAQLQAGLLHQRRLRLWFETDLGANTLWGCEPAACRALVAVAVTAEPALSAADAATVAPPTGESIP